MKPNWKRFGKRRRLRLPNRDALIEEQEQQICRLTKQADSAIGEDTEGGIQGIVQYVVAEVRDRAKNSGGD